MKRILFLISLVILAWSCSSDSEGEPLDGSNDQPSNEIKEYTVSLGMIGEILDIEESPLTKAGGNDLYGVQVYSKISETDYIPYAHGLFDDKALLKIKLQSNQIYKFVATMVVDGKRKIWYTTGGYCHPYYLGNKEYELNNSFEYNELYFDALWKGTSAIVISYTPQMFNTPNIERYYGEVLDYVPSSNGDISINMKRACFGAKFIAEGLTEGKLKINIKEAPELSISYGKTEVQDIFTFKNTYPYGSTWVKDDYSEVIPVSVSWEKSNGVVVNLIEQTIVFKRNTMSTITIKVKDIPTENTNNGIGISQESGEMIKGDDITLESGTGLDSDVDPSK